MEEIKVPESPLAFMKSHWVFEDNLDVSVYEVSAQQNGASNRFLFSQPLPLDPSFRILLDSSNLTAASLYLSTAGQLTLSSSSTIPLVHHSLTILVNHMAPCSCISDQRAW
jgi:hypothetical protein